ncbi:MAG: sulfatase-like hydrolase/transferase, partial [Candidatus Aerophobus sp.]
MNVILITVDSLQKNYVSCLGNKWMQTPHMDRLVSQSTLFTCAYPESLPTLQVRRALHTGKYVFPFRDHVARKGDWVKQPGWGPIPEQDTTLAEILKATGYRTGFVTDTYHYFKPGENFHRGFDQVTFIRGQEIDAYLSGGTTQRRKPEDFCLYASQPEQRTKSFRRHMHEVYFCNTALRQSEEDYFAPQVFREAAKWLYQNQGGEPFFLVVDSFDPHEPWDPPVYYRRMYDQDDNMEKDIIWSTYSSTSLLTERTMRRLRANYAGEITMVDYWLGYFLETIERL